MLPLSSVCTIPGPYVVTDRPCNVAPIVNTTVDSGNNELIAWLTFFVTAIAVVAAIVAAVTAWKTWRRSVADHHQAQASKVVAWAKIGEMPAPAPAGPHLFIKVRNGSDLPAFGAKLLVSAPSTGFGGPARQTYDAQNPNDLVTLVPNETSVHRVNWPSRSFPTLDEVDITLIFRDAAGVEWQRTPDGRLAEVT